VIASGLEAPMLKAEFGDRLPRRDAGHPAGVASRE
jgi:hypothetical protein